MRSPALRELAVPTLALMAVNAAALNVWLIEAHYFRRGPMWQAWAAWGASMAAILSVVLLLLLCAGTARTALVLRVSAVTAAVYLLLRVPANTGGMPAGGGFWRLLAALAVALLLVRLLQQNHTLWQRGFRAMLAASAAFIATPLVWQSLHAPARMWSPASADTTSGAPRQKVIVLFDELSDSAARPLVDTLRAFGLQVHESSVASAGPNTLQVIPAMLTGVDFVQAQACGRSSVCSGSQVLDFSAISAARPDVDVVGLLHPYCDIRGLRYCKVGQIAHDHGNAFRSLANVYLRKLGLPMADVTVEGERVHHRQRRLVEEQLAAVWRAPFWEQGGVLYLHLAMPHPPGINGLSTLDADYEANIAVAQRFTQELLVRLQQRFGNDYALLMTSDHPLRDFWCSSELYRHQPCWLRPAFKSTRVPLVLASPRVLAAPSARSNAEIFSQF